MLRYLVLCTASLRCQNVFVEMVLALKVELLFVWSGLQAANEPKSMLFLVLWGKTMRSLNMMRTQMALLQTRCMIKLML
jgi:hypothetical protein